MLNKQHRLKTKADFDYVYQKGKKKKTPYFLFIVAKRDKSELPKTFSLPRFGFVASKKVGKAVQRNRAKRKMREVIRAEFPGLRTDFEAVIICYNSLPDTPFAKLQKVTQKVLEEMNLYK